MILMASCNLWHEFYVPQILAHGMKFVVYENHVPQFQSHMPQIQSHMPQTQSNMPQIGLFC
jgi:hypothetical protein